jgi:hypothetical protein
MSLFSEQLVMEAVDNATKNSTYSLENCNQFSKARISPPILGAVNVSEFHAKNLGLPAGIHKVWFITQSTPQSVFFDEASGLFGACWGPDNVSDKYDDLGFRGPDPVDMFLV